MLASGGRHAEPARFQRSDFGRAPASRSRSRAASGTLLVRLPRPVLDRRDLGRAGQRRAARSPRAWPASTRSPPAAPRDSRPGPARVVAAIYAERRPPASRRARGRGVPSTASPGSPQVLADCRRGRPACWRTGPTRPTRRRTGSGCESIAARVCGAAALRRRWLGVGGQRCSAAEAALPRRPRPTAARPALSCAPVGARARRSLVTRGHADATACGDEVGVGPWPASRDGRPTRATTRSCWPSGDRRNVVDRYRYWRHEAIVADLDRRRHDFHVAIENWQHDLNIGTVVRNANAFLAAEVHIVGRRRWNRRGAMVTDRYQHVRHHDDDRGVRRLGRRRGPAGRRHRQPARLAAAGDGHACRGAACCCSARRARACPTPARAACAPAVLDRPVRLDPLDQRRRGQRHRDARLDPRARRSAAGVTRTDVGGFA